LLHTDALQPAAVSAFLSYKTHFHFLRQFFQSIEMKVPFVEAMRRSLGGPFVLPDKSRDVDRALGALAEAYVEQNPRVFATMGDAIYFGYALVLLHTDLLSPSPAMATAADFVRIAWNAIGHSRIPRCHIVSAYQSLKEAPFAFPPKQPALLSHCSPKKRGWLKKKHAWGFGTWTVYYVALNFWELVFYQTHETMKQNLPMAKLSLLDVNVSDDIREAKRFWIIPRRETLEYENLIGKEPGPEAAKVILFEAKTQAIADEWVVRLRKAALLATFLGRKEEGQ
jgi:hypothetical protein